MSKKVQGHISFWLFYNTRPQEERERLIPEMVQTILYNLVIDQGPQSRGDIYRYFHAHNQARKVLIRNLYCLTHESWGPDPLLVYSKQKFRLNDDISAVLKRERRREMQRELQRQRRAAKSYETQLETQELHQRETQSIVVPVSR